MANILDRFKVKAVGSSSRIADYTARITSTGDFTRIEDFEVILASWNNILLTPLRSYTFDPEYGSILYKFVFEPADAQTENAIKNEIIYRLRKFDDRAEVRGVGVEFLTNMKGYNIDVQVRYKTETGRISATIDDNLYFNFLRTT